MTFSAETHSLAVAQTATSIDELAPAYVDSAAKVTDAPVAGGDGIDHQDVSSHFPKAAGSPFQDLLVVLGITVGNLGFVAGLASAIARYAP